MGPPLLSLFVKFNFSTLNTTFCSPEVPSTSPRVSLRTPGWQGSPELPTKPREMPWAVEEVSPEASLASQPVGHWI